MLMSEKIRVTARSAADTCQPVRRRSRKLHIETLRPQLAPELLPKQGFDFGLNPLSD
jgi:hypothetical protein